ncbi:hypothetical protein [[Mycobacterium] nativiensis]|uniref:Uncharacterized protein n=1 Tax=[Mycobacterium] nativiensis TaxID=2855503 RepID=A0ABU5XSZ9_9MYCO|nr:hypothetical protein [Mycolicibacter sp. MYC340]MEB3031063.1 hypothetical protein [Mycolicibacter sp. MYC340]
MGDTSRIDAYTAALAGTQTAEEACERLAAAGCAGAVEGDSVVVDDGEVKASPFEGVNKIGDSFYLWCLHDRDGELIRCTPRGPHGSCPPRH